MLRPHHCFQGFGFAFSLLPFYCTGLNQKTLKFHFGGPDGTGFIVSAN